MPEFDPFNLHWFLNKHLYIPGYFLLAYGSTLRTDFAAIKLLDKKETQNKDKQNATCYKKET